MGERGLLDGEERADLVAAGTDDADRARDHEHEIVARERECSARGRHQRRSDDEHASPPDPIRSGAEPE